MDSFYQPPYLLGDIFPYPEGETIEFKKSINSLSISIYKETICAFANHMGGSMFLGINDVNRTIDGIELTNKEIDFWKLAFNDIYCRFYPKFKGTVRFILYQLTINKFLIEIKVIKHHITDDTLYYIDSGVAYKRCNASNRKIGETPLVDRSAFVQLRKKLKEMETQLKISSKSYSNVSKSYNDKLQEIELYYKKRITELESHNKNNNLLTTLYSTITNINCIKCLFPSYIGMDGI